MEQALLALPVMTESSEKKELMRVPTTRESSAPLPHASITEPRTNGDDRCESTHPEYGDRCELQNSHHYEMHQARLRPVSYGDPFIEWPVEVHDYHCEAFEADGRRIGGFVVSGSSMSEALARAAKNGEVKIRPWQHTIRVSQLIGRGSPSLSDVSPESALDLERERNLQISSLTDRERSAINETTVVEPRTLGNLEKWGAEMDRSLDQPKGTSGGALAGDGSSTTTSSE